jgi:3-oxoacyl-[acyl-carrier protein] reductase
MRKLENKVALVTGGSRGIGAAIVNALAEEGANIGLNYIHSQKKAEQICANVSNKFGVEALALKADVSVSSDVQNMVDSMLAKYNRIDILVNNAGIILIKKLVDTSLEEWNKMLATDMTGVFLCTRAVLPSMLKQKEGRIINITSDVGQIGSAELAVYCAAKGGIIAFTKALARELAPEGILVNSIAPGPIETDFTVGFSKEAETAKKATLPLGRFGLPEEVAPTVVFLASSAGALYVGQTLGPNSGEVMM